MKKAIQISLGGMHFNIDEDAYNLLQEYISSLRDYFGKEGEGSKEIIDDIEQRMAELLNVKISEKKQVINMEDVNEVIKTLGKIEDFEFERISGEENQNESQNPYNKRTFRRLYRDPEHAVLGGVCSGLAAYFNIEPWIVRLIFILMLFINVIIPPFISLFGFGVLLYIILWIAVPKARTTAQKLQMRGEPVTVENIKRSIHEEYHKVKSGIEGFSRSEGFQRTKSVAEEVLQVIGKVFIIIFKIIAYFIGIAFLIAGLLLLAGVGTAVLGRFHWSHRFNWPHIYFPDLSDFFTNPATVSIVTVCLIILIAIPVISLIVWGIKLLLNVKGRNRVLQASALTLWVIALIVLIAMVVTEGEAFAFQASGSSTEEIKAPRSSILCLELKNKKNYMEGITLYSLFDYDMYFDREHDEILGEPSLTIEENDQNRIELFTKKSMRNIGMKDADKYLNEINYEVQLNDSLLIFDRFFSMDDNYKWHFPEVELILKIPDNQKLFISNDVQEILKGVRTNNYYRSWDVAGKTWIMSDNGLEPYPVKEK